MQAATTPLAIDGGLARRSDGFDVDVQPRLARAGRCSPVRRPRWRPDFALPVGRGLPGHPHGDVVVTGPAARSTGRWSGTARPTCSTGWRRRGPCRTGTYNVNMCYICYFGPQRFRLVRYRERKRALGRRADRNLHGRRVPTTAATDGGYALFEHAELRPRPGQAVDVEPDGTAAKSHGTTAIPATGLPVMLSNVSDVGTFHFEVDYNPAMLTVTGATFGNVSQLAYSGYARMSISPPGEIIIDASDFSPSRNGCSPRRPVRPCRSLKSRPQ